MVSQPVRIGSGGFMTSTQSTPRDSASVIDVRVLSRIFEEEDENEIGACAVLFVRMSVCFMCATCQGH
jgi:hypothetical protein